MNPDNTRVAKNAVALTLRMVLVTIVGLYTFRIVLRALGVEDYGVYTVTAGLISTVAFLNTSMAGATSRFIAFAIGKNDAERASEVFSAAVYCHIGMAIVALIVAETVGLWFVTHKLNLPPETLDSALIIYQLSVLSMVVGFTQVPYSATILAHEKMGVYAYAEIGGAAMRLAIALVILNLPTARLTAYALLTTTLAVATALGYRYYCIRKFDTARIKRHVDRNVYRDLLAYSGYDLYGNMSETLKAQSIPVLLNLFFGVLANAAAGIALTVTNLLTGFSGAIMNAFQPQIVKRYATGDVKAVETLMKRAALFAILTFSAIAVPLIVNTNEILLLWLGEVPEYSVTFIRLMVLTLGISLIIIVNNHAIHATGDIRRLSGICGTIYLSTPVVSYLLLKYGRAPVESVYILNMGAIALSVITGLRILRIQIPEIKIIRYLCPTLKCLSAATIIAMVMILSKRLFMADNIEALERLLITTLVSTAALFIAAYICIFDKAEQQLVHNNLKACLKTRVRI